MPFWEIGDRMRIPLALPSFVLLFSLAAFSQDQNSVNLTVRRDAQALTIVQSALKAMRAESVAHSKISGSIEDEKGTNQGEFTGVTQVREYQFQVQRGGHSATFDSNA